MNIQIRKAKEADLPTIVAFQLAMALETENLRLDKTTVEKGVFAAFKDSAKGQYFVTEILKCNTPSAGRGLKNGTGYQRDRLIVTL